MTLHHILLCSNHNQCGHYAIKYDVDNEFVTAAFYRVTVISDFNDECRMMDLGEWSEQIYPPTGVMVEPVGGQGQPTQAFEEIILLRTIKTKV